MKLKDFEDDTFGEQTTENEIYISKRLNQRHTKLTLVHEFLHTLGLDHDNFGRSIGFYSNHECADVVSEAFASVIFGERLRWFPYKDMAVNVKYAEKMIGKLKGEIEKLEGSLNKK
ncbi:MAG: hypothetical protein QXJ75_02115 [Candidatus Bathyarchaeia archaeon]